MRLLDAGVSLCPNRFGFSPHPEEFKAIIEFCRRIAERGERLAEFSSIKAGLCWKGANIGCDPFDFIVKPTRAKNML